MLKMLMEVEMETNKALANLNIGDNVACNFPAK